MSGIVAFLPASVLAVPALAQKPTTNRVTPQIVRGRLDKSPGVQSALHARAYSVTTTVSNSGCSAPVVKG